MLQGRYQTGRSLSWK